MALRAMVRTHFLGKLAFFMQFHRFFLFFRDETVLFEILQL